jgi:hypothetical protein
VLHRPGDRADGRPYTLGDYSYQRWSDARFERTKRMLFDLERQLGRLPTPSLFEQEAPSEIEQEAFRQHGLLVRAILVEWVEQWLRAGKNTRQLVQQMPDIERAVGSFLAEQRLRVIWSSCGPSFTAFGKKVMTDPHAEDPKTEAARLFLELLTHFRCERIAQCDRCRCLYFSFSKRGNNRFCERRCGNAATKQRPSTVIEEEQKRNKVAQALKRWPPKNSLKQDQDWKGWLRRQPETVGVTRNWITRRSKAGIIQSPCNGTVSQPHKAEG